MHPHDVVRTLGDALVRQGVIDAEHPDRPAAACRFAAALNLSPVDWYLADAERIERWAACAASRYAAHRFHPVAA